MDLEDFFCYTKSGLSPYIHYNYNYIIRIYCVLRYVSSSWGGLDPVQHTLYIIYTTESTARDIDMILILISAMIECGLAESGNIRRIYHRNAGYIKHLSLGYNYLGKTIDLVKL